MMWLSYVHAYNFIKTSLYEEDIKTDYKILIVIIKKTWLWKFNCNPVKSILHEEDNVYIHEITKNDCECIY